MIQQIENEEYINNLFRNLARKSEIPISLGNLSGKMIFNDRKGNDIHLQFVDPEVSFAIVNNSRVTFSVQEASFAFEVNPARVDAHNYKIKKPTKIFPLFRRLLPRYTFKPGEEAYITFLNSFNKYQVIDINTKGLAFISKKRLLEKENFSVKIMINSFDIYTDGKIKHSCNKNGLYSYGISFFNMDWESYLKLFKFIFQRAYPNLRELGDFSKEEIYNLFEESGYLNLKPKNEMQVHFNDMVKVIDKIRNKILINTNSVYYDKSILSSASLLRIYNQTFLGHQLAAKVTTKTNLKSKTDIYLNLVDHILNNPYIENHLAYFINDLSWHDKMYKKIRDYINDAGLFIYDNLNFLEYNIKDLITLKINTDIKIELLDNYDEFIIFANQNLETLTNYCYGYNKENINLTELKQIYSVFNLLINRKIWRISKDNVIGYIVAEVYSNGLNLFNVLDMCRIYLNNYDNISEIFPAILNEVSIFYLQYQKNKFNILFKYHNTEKTNYDIPYLKYINVFARVMANKKGMSLYRKFLTSNYGI